MYFEFDFDSTGRAWSLCKVNFFKGLLLLIFGRDFCRYIPKKNIEFFQKTIDK